MRLIRASMNCSYFSYIDSIRRCSKSLSMPTRARKRTSSPTIWSLGNRCVFFIYILRIKYIFILTLCYFCNLMCFLSSALAASRDRATIDKFKIKASECGDWRSIVLMSHCFAVVSIGGFSPLFSKECEYLELKQIKDRAGVYGLFFFVCVCVVCVSFFCRC